MNKEIVLQALRDCYDPEVPLNVVELGVVAGVELQLDAEAPGAGIVGVPERYSVLVTLLPAGRDETVESQLVGVVRNRLAGFYELSRVSVVVAEEPVWSPARISAAGRKMLGLDGVVFPILNNRVR